jgi:putative ATP-binding cassette transporter
MSLFKWLLWQHRAWLAFVLASSVCSAAVGVSVIAYVNERLPDTERPLGETVTEFALLLLLLFVTGTVAQLAMSVLGHRAVYRLRRSLVKRVLDTDVERLEALGLPRLLTSLNGDTSHITSAFVGLPAVVYGSTLSVGGFAYLAWLSRPLFLATGFWIALTVVVAWWLLKHTHRHVELAREAEERLYEDYRMVVEGRKELSLNRARAKHVYERDFEPNAAASRRHEIRGDLFNVLNDNWVNGMALGAIGLALVLSRTYGWASSDAAATFALTVLYLRTPLTNVMAALPSLVAGSVALRKVSALELAPFEPEFRAADPAEVGFHSLRFEGVTYRYPGEANDRGFELGPLNLTVQRGEILFLIGGNGSGKSSLARVLSGLYAPHAGRVFVDDVLLADGDRTRLRSLFSSVFSDYWLFRSVLTGTGAANDAEVARWLTRLELSSKSSSKEGRLSHVLLSQGQRKRLALLVALLEDRPILLLDEWAADQDPAFRELFYTELLPELKAAGKTVIAITHDDRYFGVADRIMKGEAGTFVELTHSRVRPLDADAAKVRPSAGPELTSVPQPG